MSRLTLSLLVLLFAFGRPAFADETKYPRSPFAHHNPKRAHIFLLSGIALTTVGLVLGGVGIGSLLHSNGEAHQINQATGVFDQMLDDRSKSDRALGLGTLITSGILVVGGTALQVLGGLDF